MAEKRPVKCIKKTTVTSKGATYCCGINCTNNNRQSIDPRTQKLVRFHRFPNPVKERERCRRWIVNLQRADLNMRKIKRKALCSVHFETKCYNNPNDISHSQLLPSAVPTLIDPPDRPGPLTSTRSSKRKRQAIELTDLSSTSSRRRNPQKVPAKDHGSPCFFSSLMKTQALDHTVLSSASPSVTRSDTPLCSVQLETEDYDSPNGIISSASRPNPPTPVTLFKHPPPKKRQATSSSTSSAGAVAPSQVDHSACQDKIKKLEEKLSKAKNSIFQYQKINTKLTRLNKRLQAARVKHEAVELKLLSRLDQARKLKYETFLDKLPPIPRSLVDILLRDRDKVLWTKETEVMELCTSIFLRNTSVYSTLRSSGFTLPHPHTLRRVHSEVKKNAATATEKNITETISEVSGIPGVLGDTPTSDSHLAPNCSDSFTLQSNFTQDKNNATTTTTTTSTTTPSERYLTEMTTAVSGIPGVLADTPTSYGNLAPDCSDPPTLQSNFTQVENNASATTEGDVTETTTAVSGIPSVSVDTPTSNGDKGPGLSERNFLRRLFTQVKNSAPTTTSDGDTPPDSSDPLTLRGHFPQDKNNATAAAKRNVTEKMTAVSGILGVLMDSLKSDYNIQAPNCSNQKQ